MSNPQQPALPMRNLVIFMVASVAILFGYNYIEKKIWPPPEKLKPEQQREVRDGLAPLAGLASTGTGLGDLWAFAGHEIARNVPGEAKAEAYLAVIDAKKKEEAAKPKPPPIPEFKAELVELGGEGFRLQARFTTKGGGVDRVIVSHFPQADKNGREVIEPDGKPQPLHLIPSPNDLPDEVRRALPHDQTLPSFLLYHYADPSAQRPENTLGEMGWKIVARPEANQKDAEVQQIAFSADLKESGVRITKTFTLRRNEYHIGLAVRIEPLPGAKPGPFRYQIAGGHGVPIEGIWYTSTFRNFMTGWRDVKRNSPRRQFADGASINTDLGSEPVHRGDNERIEYAAIAGQYFASVTCVDDEQDNRNFIEYVRATAEEHDRPADKPQLGDICPRMVTEELKPAEGPIEHKYVLYHGPLKVRLLHQLRGDNAIDEALIDRYEDTLGLKTLTDYQSPSMIGRFANFIYWTDLTIATTNLMHAVLGFLMGLLKVPVLAIILLTVLVRLALMPLSRRQAATMARVQEKMAAMQPQIKALEEKFKGRDPQELQKAKMQLMLENGVNPAAQLGGCLLLFAQMPIFMGLYYALQENVFFRLESFLWIKNLAAPDMLVYWGEKIPFISDPASLGSFFYLGPYFNVLPILAVSLMIVQQKFMAPPPTDETQAQQQKLMKYMMLAFALFFYKTPSGLVLYFIISSLWGLAERKLWPKKKVEPDKPGGKGGSDDRGGNGSKLKPKPPKTGWFQQKMQQVLDAAEKKTNTERRMPQQRPRSR